MTVKELKSILNWMSDDAIIEVCIDNECGEHIADVRELIIGTDPNKVCIYAE